MNLITTEAEVLKELVKLGEKKAREQVYHQDQKYSLKIGHMYH